MKRFAIWGCLLVISSFLTFHLPGGARLSCLAIVLPLVGVLMRGRLAWLLVAAVYLVRPVPLTAGIPTLLATISWQRRSRLLHVLFPLAAMATFMWMQPGAWPYALYWLIPVFCPIRAVRATFVQHAAGSLIWLFAVPMAAEQWMALIPAVAVERLLAIMLSVAVVGLLEQNRQPHVGTLEAHVKA